MSEIETAPSARGGLCQGTVARKPSDITLVRNRIFYARPSLTAKGRIHVGFKHIRKKEHKMRHGRNANALPDVLNRCSLEKLQTMSEAELSKAEERNTLKTVKVMMYMFPRQFGLHNVFSSNVDPTMTTQKFQDYTLREEEIAKYLKSDTMIRAIPKTPKRMRGSVKTLVRSLQVHHGRCSYFELLRHYCPSMLDESIQMASTAYTDPSGNLGHGNHQPGSASTQRRRRKTPKDATNDSSQLLNEIASRPIVELATPTPKVSTFIQAAVLKIIPGGFWGTGDDGDHNRSIIGQKINHFITLRRYESANLHDLLQGFKVSHLLVLFIGHILKRQTT